VFTTNEWQTVNSANNECAGAAQWYAGV